MLNIKQFYEISPRVNLKKCPVRIMTTEFGERVKHGCGAYGLIPQVGGLRCFYCGNYVFGNLSGAESWRLFNYGREFWKRINVAGIDYINGIRVDGPDPAPADVLNFKNELTPPATFFQFAY